MHGFTVPFGCLGLLMLDGWKRQSDKCVRSEHGHEHDLPVRSGGAAYGDILSH